MTCRAHVLLCGLSLALYACDTEKKKDGDGSSGLDLEDRVFVSTSVTEDGAPRDLVAGTQLQLRFYEAPRVVASAGCNSMEASYEIDGDTFVVHGQGTTEIGCDPALHSQDEWYFGFLDADPAITLDGDALVLDSGSTRIEYLDQEVATPDFPLVGPTWTVDTIIDGDAASNADWADPATLAFADDGTVEVFTGCNAGSGTYEVDGNEITFADVLVTEKGCPDDTTMQLETVVGAVIGGPQPVTWEIEVDRLSLDGDGFGLGLVGS